MDATLRTGGRPVGSRSGRQPPGGYPNISLAQGSFLAGFIEGEASFNISRQPRNTNHRCAFSLNVRADDAALIQKLASDTRLGSITRIPARGTSHEQVAWSISAKSDCQRLVQLLEIYPLRGRKARDFAVWSAAVQWWIDGSPTKTTRNRDWTALIYLKSQLKSRRPYAGPVLDEIEDSYEGMSGDWLGFFSGFFTAEGSFGVSKNGAGYVPRAQIALRADDLPLLNALKTRTGAGHIYVNLSEHRTSPTVSWSVRKGQDLASLVDLFDSFPPGGRKGRMYPVWRRAVRTYIGPGSRRAVRRRLGELRDELAEVSAFRAQS